MTTDITMKDVARIRKTYQRIGTLMLRAQLAAIEARSLIAASISPSLDQSRFGDRINTLQINANQLWAETVQILQQS